MNMQLKNTKQGAAAAIAGLAHLRQDPLRDRGGVLRATGWRLDLRRRLQPRHRRNDSAPGTRYYGIGFRLALPVAASAP